jgi:DNA-binding GntR family transcriptional regulator
MPRRPASAPVLEDLSIAPSTTVDQIVQALSDAILGGKLAPGTRVRESALAVQLGVSRNTVREAVLILQQTGLVRHVVNRGAIVRPLEPDEVADLYRVREVLELAAVKAASAASDLTPVKIALDELEAAAVSGDVNRTVERDLNFHGSLVTLLRSPRLDEYFMTLRRELRYYLAAISYAHKETEAPHALVQQHAVVYRALKRGDNDRAHRLLREHIQLNARMVLELLVADNER